METTPLAAVIGLTTSPRHASINCKKATDEDFVVKANAVHTYSRVSIVYDLCVTFEAKNSKWLIWAIVSVVKPV